MVTFPAGEHVLGRVLRADGAPLDGGAPLDQEPRLTVTTAAHEVSGAPRILETGIKVVDFFCPLRAGGLHLISASKGVGKEVVLAEIVSNMRRHHAGCAVWVALREQHAEGHHMAQSFRESGVLPYISMIIAPSGQEYQTLQVGLALARSFALDGRPVLLGIEADLVAASAAALLTQDDSVTRLIVAHDDTSPEPPAPLVADTTMLFSQALARQNIWPAVDGVRSHSRLLDEGHVSDRHRQIARDTRNVIMNAPTSPRARRILQFGSQPFTIAEPFTARPGAYVTLADTLEGYATLLTGAYDDIPEDQLTFQGVLPSHP